MLQSGIRASTGIRISGPDLETIQRVSLDMERILRRVPAVNPATVIADRILGKPYLEIHIDRQAIAQYGIRVQQVQDVVEFAIGGRAITNTVEGRERYPVRLRYARELRDDIESLGKILVPAPNGSQIPLIQLTEIRYQPGPEAIKGENGFLVGYVIFDKRPGYSDVDAVEQTREFLGESIHRGELNLPAGVSFAFVGTYENQIRAEGKLKVILPLALVIILVILYLQFHSASTTLLVFSGIPVAWAGGFIVMWMYGQGWFLDLHVFGVWLRDLFQVQPIHLSVAVWVGFLALFGVTVDDGVVMATFLDASFRERRPDTVEKIREATVAGALRRLRPCLMITATTILALIPVLTSTGKGSEIMVPMAIPSFGGLLVEVISMFIVPVLYCAVREQRLKGGRG
jgi:Cu(I)/Ag(I) efflux system membrane protein CusA/SilA